MVIGDKTVKMRLEFDQVSPNFARFDTDSEDFTSDIELIPSESSSDEETYVVAVLRDGPFEPDLRLSRPEVDDTPDLLDLLEEYEDSESEEEKEETFHHINVVTEATEGLGGRLAHLQKDDQDILENALLQKNVVASSLKDLRPAKCQLSITSTQSESTTVITECIANAANGLLCF